ncbi:MAG: ATP-binding protein [Smithella sp.]|jgi:two-component system sensor histidine kinase PilS (NtrC family)
MTITHEDILTKEKNTQRLFFLIISRIAIITSLLGITIFIDVKKQLFSIPYVIINYFYFIAAVIYLFSAIYALLYKFRVNFILNIYLQITLDILAVTFLIFMFGNTQIDYSLLYTLVIIYSAIFLGRRGGMLVASVSSIFYGLFLNLEFYKLMPSWSVIKYDYNLNTADALTNLIVRITSFYLLAFLASFIIEQEKKTSSLLEEKESEFNQLDLLFRSIVESVYTGVMTANLNNTIKTFNNAAEEITGFSRERVQGLGVGDVFPEFLQFMNKETINEQTTTRIEITIKGKKGNNINLGLSVSPLKGKSEKQIGNILIFQDITKIKQMEKALEKSRNMALIGEMAAGWAHEVRNPLAAITGSIEILQQGLELEGINKRLMEIVLRSKDQLENFVRNFLLLARSVPSSREPVDINEVVVEILENLRLSKEWDDKIKINNMFSENAGVFANKEQVRQIINNLMSNAIEAMEEGGLLSIETKQIQLNDKKKYAEVIISDTGCGIKEDDLNKIFEPFFTKKERGTGLGLAIVNHIVEGYKGKIEIESEAGKGTTCRVLLPVEKDEDI